MKWVSLKTCIFSVVSRNLFVNYRLRVKPADKSGVFRDALKYQRQKALLFYKILT